MSEDPWTHLWETPPKAPVLAPDEVHLWKVPLTQPGEHVFRLYSLLSPGLVNH